MWPRAVAGLISILLLVASPAVPATADSGARATLDGQPLPLVEVAEHHCHDLYGPVITCYRTSAQLEAAVKSVMDDRDGTKGVAAVSYVRIFEHVDRQGASMYVAQDYTNLGSIGWNDRISAFRSVNAGAGKFYHDSYMSGMHYAFCCGVVVENVGSTHNDKFTSVERA
jgi:hypothetical protein